MAKEHAQAIAGTYIFARRSDSSFLSVLNLATPLKVVVNEDGTISLPLLRGLNGEPVKWHETEPYVWTRQRTGKEHLAAEVVNGRVTRFARACSVPSSCWSARPPRRAGAWLMPTAAASLVALALTVIFWPVAALVRRHYRRPLPFAGREAKAYRWVRIGALASLAAMSAWVGIVAAMFNDLALLIVEDGSVDRGPALARYDRSLRRPRACGLASRSHLRREAALARQDLEQSFSSLRRPCAPGSLSPTTWSASARTTDAAFGLAGADPAVGPVHDHGVHIHRDDRGRRAAQRARRDGRRRSRGRLLPQRRRRSHVRSDRGRAARRRGRCRSRIVAPSHANRRRAQRARLRAVGPRGQAAATAGLAHRRARAPAAATHDLHRARERPGRNGREGRRLCAGEIAEVETDRRTAARCRARARGAQSPPRRLDRRRRQPGV